jgi:hypothetical protein
MVIGDNTTLHDLVKLPGEKIKKPIKQVSFTSSLKPIIDSYKPFLHTEKAVANALDNMWSALKEKCPESFKTPKKYLLLKTPGIFVMHKLFVGMLPTLYKIEDFSKGMFLTIFNDPDVDVFFSDSFWESKPSDPTKKSNELTATYYGTSAKAFKLIQGTIWDELEKVLEKVIKATPKTLKMKM